MSKKWTLLIFLSLSLPLFALLFGAAELTPQQISHCLLGDCGHTVNQLIFWEIRLPRVIAGFLVGGGLAIAGATLQNVTRNGLADPYLFGIMAGAGLGASIATLWVGTDAEQIFSITLPVAAFSGALLAAVLVQLLARSSLGRTSEQLLLAGVAMSLMLSALTHFMLYLADPFAANKVVFWMMGSLSRVEMSYVWILLTIVTISLLLLLLFARHLDALMLGDESAMALGVHVTRLRMLSLSICAALTAAIVAYCGGIGFVGLMIPHIVRRWLGVTNRILIPGCLLLGGCFLVSVDVVARSAMPEQELPIGIITSAIGSLFFLIAMRKQ